MRSGSPVWLARVEQMWSWILARRGDVIGAAAHLARARAIAQPVGMNCIPDVVASASARATPAPLPDGLTAREAEVLALLAAGTSNRDIASCLFISPNTAANHVRSILQKTGSANRTEAAVYAIRNGIGREPRRTDA